MKLIPIIILAFLLDQSIYSQAVETVKVTLVRKKVQVTLGDEKKIPKIGDLLPLTATVQSEGMGYMEFKYKGLNYRIGKNTTIVISEVLNSTAEAGITNSGGVRAKVNDPESKPNVGSSKPPAKKKKLEDK